MLEMNAKIRKEWCAALRSGAYEQAQGVMRVGPECKGHCCLGVLTALYVKAGNPETYDIDPKDSRPPLNVWNNGILSTPVQVWAGLKEPNPTLAPDPNDGPEGLTAVYFNDGDASFDDIADLIDDGEGKPSDGKDNAVV